MFYGVDRVTTRAAAICPSIEADATQNHWIEGHGYIRGWLVFVLQEDSSRSAGRTNNVVTAISLFPRQATENRYERWMRRRRVDNCRT